MASSGLSRVSVRALYYSPIRSLAQLHYTISSVADYRLIWPEGSNLVKWPYFFVTHTSILVYASEASAHVWGNIENAWGRDTSMCSLTCAKRSIRTKMALASYFLLVALVISNLAAATVHQTVNLGYATYQGTFNNITGVTSFLGMRYANPPAGMFV